MARGRFQYTIDINGKYLSIPPGIIIQKRDTDKSIVFNTNKDRLENIAQDYYGSSSYWWIIAMANPDIYLEFDVVPNTVIRIPLPLNDVIGEVQDKILDKKNIA